MFAIALGFAVVPPGKAIDPVSAMRKSLRDTRAGAERSSLAAAHAQEKVVARTWGLQPEALGVQVMDAVGRIAERRGLQVGNFVVGRPIASGGLRQVPFVVTLNGVFPDVLATMAELEKPRTKLVLGAVKLVPLTVAGVEGASTSAGRVTATLTITAFLRERSV